VRGAAGNSRPYRDPLRILYSLATTAILLLVVPIISGCVAVGFVVVGTQTDIPNFNPTEGYFGTHFLDGFLYAIADLGFDWLSVTIVGVLWFFYAFIGSLALLSLPIAALSVLFNLMWPSKHVPNNTQP